LLGAVNICETSRRQVTNILRIILEIGREDMTLSRFLKQNKEPSKYKDLSDAWKDQNTFERLNATLPG